MTDIGRKAWALTRWVILFELRLWRSLYRWIMRRPRATEPDAQLFSSAGAVTPAIIGFIVVSTIEIPILHLILPWPTVQMISIVVGVQSVLWMIGLLASLQIHPHVVSSGGVRVRQGSTLAFTIPWDAIATVGTRIRSLPTGKTVQYDRSGDEPILNIGVSSQTNVDIVLHHPITVTLPKGPSEAVSQIRVYADDSGALAAAVRAHLAAEAPLASNGRV